MSNLGLEHSGLEATLRAVRERPSSATGWRVQTRHRRPTTAGRIVVAKNSPHPCSLSIRSWTHQAQTSASDWSSTRPRTAPAATVRPQSTPAPPTPHSDEMITTLYSGRPKGPPQWQTESVPLSFGVGSSAKQMKNKVFESSATTPEWLATGSFIPNAQRFHCKTSSSLQFGGEPVPLSSTPGGEKIARAATRAAKQKRVAHHAAMMKASVAAREEAAQQKDQSRLRAKLERRIVYLKGVALVEQRCPHVDERRRRGAEARRERVERAGIHVSHVIIR